MSCCWLIYGGCGWCRGGGVLVSNNCFVQQNITASLLELYFNGSMQTVYACGGGGDGSQQREVADGADVVFTDTGIYGMAFGKIWRCICCIMPVGVHTPLPKYPSGDWQLLSRSRSRLDTSPYFTKSQTVK